MIAVSKSRRKIIHRLACLIGRHRWITVTRLCVGPRQVSRVCTRCFHPEYADEQGAGSSST